MNCHYFKLLDEYSTNSRNAFYLSNPTLEKYIFLILFSSNDKIKIFLVFLKQSEVALSDDNPMRFVILMFFILQKFCFSLSISSEPQIHKTTAFDKDSD